MKSKLHAMSPYILTLCALGILLSLPIAIYAFVCYVKSSVKESGDLLAALSPTWLLLVLVLDGRETISFFRIKDDVIFFYTPFRKTIQLDLNDCVDIGIDYGVISGGIKQYWFYFSLDRIPHKYFHRINRTKYSKRLLRIEYREEIYDEFISILSPAIRNKLILAHSVIENEKRKEKNGNKS